MSNSSDKFHITSDDGTTAFGVNEHGNDFIIHRDREEIEYFNKEGSFYDDLVGPHHETKADFIDKRRN